MADEPIFPDEGELVVCTVTSVQSHSVFVRIDEYKISGMIHISEIAPGRIRNIRDFVSEGKSVICKVLRVNTERGHVDLSLRRVSDSQRRKKVNEVKKEKFSQKLIELAAHNTSTDAKALYASVSAKVREHYVLTFECFTDVAKGAFDLAELGLPKNTTDELKKIILDRLKPEVIVSKGVLSLKSYEPNGVEIVKQALESAEKNGAKVRYLGGGNYSISFSAQTYKEAENSLEKAASAALDFIKSKHGEGEFSEA